MTRRIELECEAEYCKTKVELTDPAQPTPAGWVRVQEFGDAGGVHELCSLDCVGSWSYSIMRAREAAGDDVDAAELAEQVTP